jgi:hypothetical protein
MESLDQQERVVKRAAELVVMNKRSHLDALEIAMDEELVGDDVAVDDFVRPLELRLEAVTKTKKAAKKDPDAAALARATQAMDTIVRGIGRPKVEDKDEVEWISGTPPKSSSWTRTLDVMDMLDRRVKDSPSACLQ